MAFRTSIFVLSAVLFGCSHFTHAYSQDYRSLTKGDTVPDIAVKYSRNGKDSILRLYDIRKKLVILDFWATWCSSCINQMPHVAELSEKFENEIEIFAVTKEKRQVVAKLMDRMQKSGNEKISTAFQKLKLVVDDSTLTSIFPHDGYPTHIWIENGKILRATAYSNTTTSENILAFINDNKTSLAEMGERGINRQDPTTWFHNDTGFLSNLKYYSAIFSRIEHTGGNDGEVFAERDTLTGCITGFNIVNARIGDLYKLAFFKYQQPNIAISDSKLFLAAKERQRFIPEREESQYFTWANKNLFCYTVKVAPENSDDLYVRMKNDLDWYFNLESKLELKMVKCLVLRETKTGVRKFRSRNKKEFPGSLEKISSDTLYVQNQPMSILYSLLINLVQSQDPFLPVLNETTYKGMIDVSIPWEDDIKQVSIKTVSEALSKFGFLFQEEYRNLEMLVLTDKK